MNDYSKTWKSSRQPRKQRNYKKNAPMHARKNFMRSKLSKELAQKYGKRNIPARKGDTVKIMRGTYRGKEGKIERVDTKNSNVFITGIEVPKREGTKTFPPIAVSNVMITAVYAEDKKRMGGLKKGTEKK